MGAAAYFRDESGRQLEGRWRGTEQRNILPHSNILQRKSLRDIISYIYICIMFSVEVLCLVEFAAETADVL